MEIDLRYEKGVGVYLLNGVRVVLLPRGGLEFIQDYVNDIIGLATKNIFEDAMATIVYSFLIDLIKGRALKRHGDERMLDEISHLFEDLGFGRMYVVSKDVDSIDVGISGNFNSVLSVIKPLKYCFAATGMIGSILRVILGKNVTVTETSCRTAGGQDADTFHADISAGDGSYNYVGSKSYTTKKEVGEKVVLIKSESGPVVNSIPVEVVPAVFFPYLFSKLREMMGRGMHDIQYGMGFSLAKMYADYDLEGVGLRHGTSGFGILPYLLGTGAINPIMNEYGGLKEIDVYDSFNALHTDTANEKRCFFLSGLIGGLSYRLFGTQLKVVELECSAMNNSFCKFSFQ